MKWGAKRGLLLCALAMTPLGAAEMHHKPAAPGPVLAELQAGNRRFVAGRAKHPHTEPGRVRETGAHGQHPRAVVLACADSRVSPELVFDQGIGDLFTIRVAGNVANEDEAASVEYAAEHLGTSVCVVLGHTGCGAVTAVAHGDALPKRFDHLLSPIRHSVNRLRKERPSLHGAALVDAAVRANVWEAAADLLQHNEALRARAQAGKLTVIGAVYDTRTGTVRWLGHHPDERTLLKTKG